MDDAQQFQEIMAAYGGKPGKPSRKLLALLRDSGVTDQAIEYLAGYVLKTSSGVNAIYLYSLKELFEINTEEGVPIAIRDGLLIVGSCPDGDPVAVDVRESLGAAGYIGHETMWQESDVRDVFKVLAPGLGALAAGLDSDAMPLDYYEAVKRG